MKGRLNLIQFSIIPVTVKNPCQLHYLRLFVDGIDDPIFPLCYPKADETSIGKMGQLFRIRGTGRTAEAENLEKNLAEAFGVAVTKIFECCEDGLRKFERITHRLSRLVTSSRVRKRSFLRLFVKRADS